MNYCCFFTSSRRFETGPPSIESIEIARVVDRGIRESEAIDVKKLCIEPKEKVWTVIIDACPINAEGNILDAAGLELIHFSITPPHPQIMNNIKSYLKNYELLKQLQIVEYSHNPNDYQLLLRVK